MTVVANRFGDRIPCVLRRQIGLYFQRALKVRCAAYNLAINVAHNTIYNTLTHMQSIAYFMTMLVNEQRYNNTTLNVGILHTQCSIITSQPKR